MVNSYLLETNVKGWGSPNQKPRETGHTHRGAEDSNKAISASPRAPSLVTPNYSCSGPVLLELKLEVHHSLEIPGIRNLFYTHSHPYAVLATC